MRRKNNPCRFKNFQASERKNHGLTFPAYSEKFIKDLKNSFSAQKHLTTSIQDTSREKMENYDETIAQQLLAKIDLI